MEASATGDIPNPLLEQVSGPCCLTQVCLHQSPGLVQWRVLLGLLHSLPKDPTRLRYTLLLPHARGVSLVYPAVVRSEADRLLEQRLGFVNIAFTPLQNCQTLQNPRVLRVCLEALLVQTSRVIDISEPPFHGAPGLPNCSIVWIDLSALSEEHPCYFNVVLPLLQDSEAMPGIVVLGVNLSRKSIALPCFVYPAKSLLKLTERHP
mmetsp:Transcript_23147/g.36205  ORF Transcript_23147/g.36205 Transcript_23147/m.36205 type:complete len:206 (-) Transcript_23147:897-1514(-)